MVSGLGCPVTAMPGSHGWCYTLQRTRTCEARIGTAYSITGAPDPPKGHLDDETMGADPVAAHHACRQHLQRLKSQPATSGQCSPP